MQCLASTRVGRLGFNILAALAPSQYTTCWSRVAAAHQVCVCVRTALDWHLKASFQILLVRVDSESPNEDFASRGATGLGSGAKVGLLLGASLARGQSCITIASRDIIQLFVGTGLLWAIIMRRRLLVLSAAPALGMQRRPVKAV